MDGEKVAIAFELAADVDLATPASRLSSRGALSALPKKGGGEERPIRKRTSAVGGRTRSLIAATAVGQSVRQPNFNACLACLIKSPLPPSLRGCVLSEAFTLAWPPVKGINEVISAVNARSKYCTRVSHLTGSAAAAPLRRRKQQGR